MEQEILQKFSFLELSILSTLMYYDIFDYPLTEIELTKWLYMPEAHGAVDLVQVRDVLYKTDRLKPYIETKNGFWFLHGRSTLVKQRAARYRVAQYKYRKSLHIMKYFRFLPFLRAVWITNTLSYNNTRDESDIDFFIVTKPGKIWLSRFLFVGALKMLGMRPGQFQTNKNKMCLNFFISSSQLGLPSMTLRNKADEIVDVHLASLSGLMVPLYDPENLLEKFHATNDWMRAFFGNEYYYKINTTRSVQDTFVSRAVKKIAEKLLSSKRLEKRIKEYQLRIMPVPLKQASLRNDTNVYLSDDILKFHLNDTRVSVLKEFHRRYQKFVQQRELEEMQRFRVRPFVESVSS